MPLIEDENLPNIASMRMSQTTEVPQHIRTKNRRKRYLDLHPEYFGPSLELADPLLYDRLVRRFQTASEREAEGRAKGYSGTLEADLLRSEAKLEALHNPDQNSLFVYRRGGNGEILAEEKDEIPLTKEEGFERWKEVMEQRFLTGSDTDFDYVNVDSAEEWDDAKLEDREREEEWFDGQTPEFVTSDGGDKDKMKLEGETGIQDF